MKKSSIAAAVLLALGGAGMAQTAQAALTAGTVLQFTPGTIVTDANGNQSNVTPGSWFGMDLNGNSKISGTEKTAMSPGRDGGIIIGVSQDTNGHVSHGGTPHAGVGGIDIEWGFGGNAGMSFTATAITDLTGSGLTRVLDFSGWRVTWNAIPSINMSTGAWGAGYTNGQAIIVCSSVNCNVGDTFTLTYAARVPAGDPSGFGGVQYFVNLEGSIAANTPPVAAATSTSTTSGTAVGWTPSATDANNDTPITCAIVSQPAGGEGTASVAADCSSGSYTPGGFAGPSTSFTYRACDPYGCGAAATVSVSISATPPPVCSADSATASGTTGVNIAVLGNDTDADGTIVASTVVISTAATSGVATANADGTVTYTNTSGSAGTDTFAYTVEDNDGQACTPATVTVTVTPVTTADDLSSSKTSGGCSLTGGQVSATERGDWWIVAGFLAWLGALRMRSRRQARS